MNRKWTTEENTYLIENYGKISSVEIAKFLGRNNRKNINKHARKLGIKFPENERISQRRHYLNLRYFDIPNIENSYYAGFIAGDGWISNDLVDITIAEKDIDILYNFKKDIACDYDVKIIEKQQEGWSNKASLRIYSKYIVSKLLNVFNIGEKKSFTLSHPNLNDDCSLSYIIGLLDADGWIYYTSDNYLQLGICGTKEILTWINFIFIKEFGISANITPNGSIYSWKITGKRAIILGNELMKIKTPFRLPRKWDKPELKDYN